MNDYIIQDKIDRQIKQGEPKDQHFMEDDKEPRILIPDDQAKARFEEEKNKLVESVKDYNEDMVNLDIRYSEGVVPVNGKLLVRTYMINPVNEDGVFVGFGVKYVKKKGNEHQYEAVPNPFPYDIRAIVVAKDPNVEEYEVGDEVQLHHKTIDVMPLMGTQTLYNPNTFERYDATFDMDNPYEHFGYLMIRPGDIQCKLK